MDIVTKAKLFAAQRHHGQKRKYSDAPYTVHLDAVVGILQQHGIDAPPVLAAAYLHDTVEDTETGIQDIIREFGDAVAELVYWLSNMEQGNRASRNAMSAWRLARAPIEAKLIKCADIIDNTCNIAEHDPNFAVVFTAEKRAILKAMVALEGHYLTELPIYRAAIASSARRA